MNRAMRRAQASMSRDLVKQRPAKLTAIPRTEWPTLEGMTHKPVAVWVSQKYLVQIFDEQPFNGITVMRATVCRVTITNHGQWNAGIEWEELQQIKSDVGFGEWYAMELFPQDSEVVNVANMRHLWMLEKPLSIGWFKKQEST